MARPSKYQPGFAKIAEKLCQLGGTDRDVAEALNVSEATVNNWKREFPEFMESLKTGKAVSDAEVEKSLYKRAIGYEVVETTVVKFKTGTRVKTVTRHIPPDPTSCIFWLKNRMPDKWRDRQELAVSSEDMALAIQVREMMAEMEASGELPSGNYNSLESD